MRCFRPGRLGLGDNNRYSEHHGCFSEIAEKLYSQEFQCLEINIVEETREGK